MAFALNFKITAPIGKPFSKHKHKNKLIAKPLDYSSGEGFNIVRRQIMTYPHEPRRTPWLDMIYYRAYCMKLYFAASLELPQKLIINVRSTFCAS